MGHIEISTGNSSIVVVAIRRISPSYATHFSPFYKKVEEYLKFLILKARKKDLNATKLSPSGEVDAIWHCHLLDTRDYMETCSYLLTYMIHHNPDGGNDATAQERRLSRTREYYREIFGYRPSPDFWGRSTSQRRAMKIFVKTRGDKAIVLDAKPSDTIETIKGKIHAVEDIPSDQQFLIFAGKDLENGHTLSYYDIENESVLNLAVY